MKLPPPNDVIGIDPDAYREALEFLWSRINYERTATVPYSGRSFKLDRMRRLLEMLGNPQFGQKIVHIGGTKGKGSTAAMIASILTASGRKTGTYSSPHLHRLEERMAIDGHACTEQELVDLVGHVRPIVEQLDAAADTHDASLGRPTYFEIVTAMALLHFAKSEVDVIVLEVGLGGRLDSTNVCDPLVSVITNISFDHTKQLGSTLAAIAGEKAGIIKAGIQVVSGVMEAEPRDVIRRIAEERGSELFELGRDFDFEYCPPQQMTFVGSACQHLVERLDQLELSLIGRHQAANAALAVAVMGVLRSKAWKISDHAIRQGLAAAACPARVEVIAGEPTIVIDAAHNVASIQALLATMDESFGKGRRVLVFATTQDKDARGMLSELLPAFDHVVLTRYLNNPRCVPPAELATIADERSDAQQHSVTVCEDPAKAWQDATHRATAGGLICVTGSFYIAAEIRQMCRS